MPMAGPELPARVSRATPARQISDAAMAFFSGRRRSRTACRNGTITMAVFCRNATALVGA